MSKSFAEIVRHPARFAATLVVAAALALFAVMLVRMVEPTSAALAPADPVGCTRVGHTLLLDIYVDTNNNGSYDSADQLFTNPAQQGQTLFFVVTLAAYPGRCGVEGGALTIDPPGSVGPTDVTPAGGIPILCASGPIPATQCTAPGPTFIVSNPLTYVVNCSDLASSVLPVSATWGPFGLIPSGFNLDAANTKAGSSTGTSIE